MVSSRKKILSFAITALGLLTLFLVAVNIGSLTVNLHIVQEILLNFPFPRACVFI